MVNGSCIFIVPVITNGTGNETSNGTGNETSNGTITNNEIINGTINSTELVNITSTLISNDALSSMLRNPSLRLLNIIPSSRKLMRPIFAFFFNFDDLALYYYHDRPYGATFSGFFKELNNFEAEKWALIDIKKQV